MSEDIIKKKSFPASYPKDVLDIISCMSMTNMKEIQIMGSMSLRSQQYAGDYDLIEQVNGKYASDDEAIDIYVRRFQSIVKAFLHRKDCYIGDIKSGEIPEWKVIPDTIREYKYVNSVKQLKSMFNAHIINEVEYKEAFDMLKRIPTPSQFIEMKRNIKFHIIRWTPKEVIGGAKRLSDGRTYYLRDAFASPSLTKLDIVAFVQNARFTDFSCIYIFENKGKVLNRVDTGRLDEGIQEDISFYSSQENWFKVAKRIFSIAKLQKNTAVLDKLNELLNGDLGRLYSIVSDANTILYLLENETEIPIAKIRYEIDQFRARYANIYTLKTAIKKEPYVLESILKMQRLPNTIDGRKTLIHQMERLIDFFETLLNKNAKQELDELNLL